MRLVFLHITLPSIFLIFVSRYVLYYFGFSFCPDICPEEMEKQSFIVDRLDEMFKNTDQPQPVTPVYVSVDPGRDTCAQTGSYCSEFNKR
jgi:protein SCO1